MDPKKIQISDYNYTLPDERIARYPLPQRDHSRLLVYNHGHISDDVFHHLPGYLPEGALMVFNNTRVIQARLHFRKRQPADGGAWRDGALIEVFLLEPAAPADYELMFQARGHCSWLCLVGNLKKWRGGAPLQRTLDIGGTPITVTAAYQHEQGTGHLVSLRWTTAQGDEADVPFADVIDAMGELPIPPYLNRDTEESDHTTYQTVYSKIKGSVAAPTAGLHFTPQVLAELDARGIDREEVTLHVGAGTFRPVKSAVIAGHDMHTEFIAVRRQTLEKLLRHHCQAIAVGTTSVRTLESLYYMGVKVLRQPGLTEEQLHVAQWEPYDGDDTAGCQVSAGVALEAASVPPLATPAEPTAMEAIGALLGWMDRRGLSVLHSSTQIIIVPGYRYKVVSRLVTNFHQPQSTLLLLVSAFVNGQWRAIYDYALGHGFRFLSYGDSSLLIP